MNVPQVHLPSSLDGKQTNNGNFRFNGNSIDLCNVHDDSTGTDIKNLNCMDKIYNSNNRGEPSKWSDVDNLYVRKFDKHEEKAFLYCGAGLKAYTNSANNNQSKCASPNTLNSNVPASIINYSSGLCNGLDSLTSHGCMDTNIFINKKMPDPDKYGDIADCKKWCEKDDRCGGVLSFFDHTETNRTCHNDNNEDINDSDRSKSKDCTYNSECTSDGSDFKHCRVSEIENSMKCLYYNNKVGTDSPFEDISTISDNLIHNSKYTTYIKRKKTYTNDLEDMSETNIIEKENSGYNLLNNNVKATLHMDELLGGTMKELTHENFNNINNNNINININKILSVILILILLIYFCI
jgi:hypothetical protein